MIQKHEAIQKLLHFYGVLADSAIFRLPGKKIEECCQRLTDECEGNPENAVANDSAVDAIHFLQRRGDGDQGELRNHAYEGDPYFTLANRYLQGNGVFTYYIMCRYSYK